MKVLWLLLIPMCFLWAHPGDTTTLCQKKYVVGINNFAPFAYRVNGKLQGLARDVIADLSERTGCQFVMNEVSRPASVEDLKRGRLDLVALVVNSNDYQAYGDFLPLYKTHRELAILKSNWSADKKISDYIADEKIKFASMIGPKSVLSSEEENKLVSSGRMVATPDPEGAMHLLSQGRAQALLMSAFLLDYHVKKENLQDRIVRIPDNKSEFSVGFFASKRRMNEEDKKVITQAFEAMKSDGSLLKILNKYMSLQEAQRRVRN